MSKIGIDLGTTYTTLCYVNERKQPLEDGYIEVYRPVDTGSVPSAVAYHKKTGLRPRKWCKSSTAARREG